MKEIIKRKGRADEYKLIEHGYKKEEEVWNAINKIKGVHGSLRSLGRPAKGYELAVETAIRGLASIVVDSTAVAEQCISVINSKGLSRTTFIILDRLPKGIDKIHDKLLWKYVECEQIYRPAFYYAIGPTIVANTLDEARRIAYGKKRERVVTVNGELLEKNGVMSGGKQAKQPKSINELEKISKIMENKLKEEKEKRDKIRKAMELEVKIKQIKEKIENRNKENKVASNKIKQIEELKIKIAKINAKPLPEQASQLMERTKEIYAKINSTEKIIRELKGKLSIEHGCDKLQSKLLALQKDKQNIEMPNKLEWNNELIRAYLQIIGVEPTCAVIDSINETEQAYKEAFTVFKELQAEMMRIKEELGQIYNEEAEIKSRIEDVEESLAECERIKQNCKEKQRRVELTINEIKEILSGADNLKLNNQRDEQRLEQMNENELRKRSKELIKKIEKEEVNIAQSINNDEYIEGIQQYKESQINYNKSKEKIEFVEHRLVEIKTKLESANSMRMNRFSEGLGEINKSMREIFTAITCGGNAELEVVNFLDPFGEGIQLMVMPPKKTWKRVTTLSGGERTLSSISLIFAMHKFKPSPIYIMDEIDAALDNHNVGIIAEYIQRINSQFIVISLRSNMFESARKLIGIYKTNNISQALPFDVTKLMNED